MVDKSLEQVSLKVSESNLEVVLLLDEIFLKGREIRALLLNDQGQQLVLKTLLCDSEVDQCAFSLDFRRVVRIRKLGVQEQLEFGVQRQLFITHLDVGVLSLFNNCAGINWLDDCVDGVFQVFNKHRFACLNGLLKSWDELFVGQSGNLEVSVSVALLNPGDALELRVNHQSVAV